MDPVTQRLIMAAGAKATPVVLEDGVANGDTINFATTPTANTLILFFGERGGATVNLPSGYTTIAQRTGNNPYFLCAYKVAAGNETSVTSTDTETVGYAFVSAGAVLDVTGAIEGSTSGGNVNIPGITPANPSLVFLVATANANSTAVSQDGTGWTEVFNSVTELSVSREIVVWSKPGDGTATGTVNVDFNTNPIAGVQFSVKF